MGALLRNQRVLRRVGGHNRKQPAACAPAAPAAAARPVTRLGAVFSTARPRGVRHPSMILAGAVGFFGATAHGMIQAQSRLMGYSPNAVSEMKKVRLPLRHVTKRAHAQPSSPLRRYCRGTQTGFGVVAVGGGPERRVDGLFEAVRDAVRAEAGGGGSRVKLGSDIALRRRGTCRLFCGGLLLRNGGVSGTREKAPSQTAFSAPCKGGEWTECVVFETGSTKELLRKTPIEAHRHTAVTQASKERLSSPTLSALVVTLLLSSAAAASVVLLVRRPGRETVRQRRENDL